MVSVSGERIPLLERLLHPSSDDSRPALVSRIPPADVIATAIDNNRYLPNGWIRHRLRYRQNRLRRPSNEARTRLVM